MHADRTNRAILALFGLLVLAVGAAAMTASFGGFGTAFARRVLLDNKVSVYIGQHGTWVWAAAAFVCLLIALAALVWIWFLLASTDRAGDITVPGSDRQGSTTLEPGALTGALTGEIESYHGVDSASGRIVGNEGDPQVVVTITARQSADLAALHRRTETEALAHARQALGRPDLPIRLDLDVSRRS